MEGTRETSAGVEKSRTKEGGFVLKAERKAFLLERMTETPVHL